MALFSSKMTIHKFIKIHEKKKSPKKYNLIYVVLLPQKSGIHKCLFGLVHKTKKGFLQLVKEKKKEYP